MEHYVYFKDINLLPNVQGFYAVFHPEYKNEEVPLYFGITKRQSIKDRWSDAKHKLYPLRKIDEPFKLYFTEFLFNTKKIKPFMLEKVIIDCWFPVWNERKFDSKYTLEMAVNEVLQRYPE